MADLFSMTVPLLARFPDGRQAVMVDYLPHPDGLVFFMPFWDSMQAGEGLHLLRGTVRGDGPWKVGDAVVTVLGCHGTNPLEAAEYAGWQVHCQQLGEQYPDRVRLMEIAREAGFYDSGS